MSDPAVEKLSAELHEIYQTEAKRQGDVRHSDNYEQLSENTKNYDRVLADDPKCRDDDMYLCLQVWAFQGVRLSKDAKARLLKYAIHPETIRRFRQKIQEHGRWPASLEVGRARRRSAEEHRTMFGND